MIKKLKISIDIHEDVDEPPIGVIIINTGSNGVKPKYTINIEHCRDLDELDIIEDILWKALELSKIIPQYKRV